jgi:hypothetical protein
MLFNEAVSAAEVYSLRRMVPNVAAKLLALLLLIPEVMGSNLGPKTGFPD